MSEGKELLLKAINNMDNIINSINRDNLIINDDNILDLYYELSNNHYSLYLFNDDVIDIIIKSSNSKFQNSYKSNITKLRDLLQGQKYYNLKFNLTDKNDEIIDKFVNDLKKYISNINPEIINLDITLDELNNLKYEVKNNLLIGNIKIIEKIVKYYDELNFDKNMYLVLNFVTENNLINQLSKKSIKPIVKLKGIKITKLSDEVLNILDKLNVNIKNIPNYLYGELKRINPEIIINNYNIIRKNKAEDGGILHLINKDNILAKLSLLAFSSEETIKGVVSSLIDDNKIDINTLKTLLNYSINIFFTENSFYKSKYHNYIKNIKLLKENDVNFKNIISSNPLLVTMDNELLLSTLNYLNRLGLDKKTILNKCYRVLSINPTVLIDNVEVLKNNGVDLSLFFQKSNLNYNLIKVYNMEERLKEIVIKNNLPKDLNDYTLLNKVLINNVYNAALMNTQFAWGDEND